MDQGTPATPAPATVKVGQGTISFKIEDQQYDMKPTVAAMKLLSLRYGGLQTVMDRIIQMDLSCIEDVLTSGLGVPYSSNPRKRETLMTKVYGLGLTDDTGGFVNICQRYVLSLMRGGKPPAIGKDDDGEEQELTGNAKSSSE